MTDDGALQFAERVIALIDAGRKSATYKLATLIALIDVAGENTLPSGPPIELHARDIGRRVIELYWPQTVAYNINSHGAARTLRQSPQNDIPAKLATWRQTHALDLGASIDDARRADPDGWKDLESQLIGTVIGMPLAKLQRFGDSRTAAEDRFIYDFGWPDEIKASATRKPQFDDTIELQPNVGGWLVQLAPLLRPLVQAKWAALVARQNPDLVDAHQLDEFLFGAARISLERVRQPLTELQRGRCFYCGLPMRTVEVDHFLPWSRHPDNMLDNLVAAHRQCNAAKSASIAAQHHLEAWCRRTNSSLIGEVAAEIDWPRRRPRTIGAVSATYLSLPPATRLWVQAQDYEPLDATRVRESLSALTLSPAGI